MAKRNKAKSESSPTKDLLKRIRERYKLMVEADEDNRRMAMEDMKFTNVPGEQWDAQMKKDRGLRPCYEFNKLRVSAKRVINDMRANRPAGKVRGVEGADKDTADIYEGLIRNIWNISDGDTVIDQAAEYQVSGGMGAWRITTRYVAEDVFEQDIVIEQIQNPFCLYADPACKDALKKDARDFILTDKISEESYTARWPKAEKVDWEEGEFDDDDEWDEEDSVRIVEYWWKEPYDKEIWQLQDGVVIDATSDEAKLIPQEAIKQKRSVACDRVKMCIASGDAILEGPSDWAGKDLPFVMVYGEFMVIDGKKLWWGLPRFGKDAQRSYNISRTSIDETIAQAPQAKWWSTVEQAKGNTAKWAEAHKQNFPFLLYNPDPKAPGPPARMGGPEMPVALVQQAVMASDDIKATLGIFDASLGNRSNETSGVAINARKEQGEIATFNYMDNLGKGIRRTWEILVDLIPKVYDTERELRILGTDGAEDYARVNQVVQDPASGKMIKVNDLSTGRYDVTVTIGPSWSTRRQEAAETYLNMSQGPNNPLMQVAGDLIFKSMDLPYAEDISERLKLMLPPQIQQSLSEGKQIPPEAQAVMAQATQAMQMVEQQMQQIQQASSQVQQDQAQVEKGKSEIQVAVANLKTQQAQFEALVAKELANLTNREAQLKVSEAVNDGDEAMRAKAEESAGTIAAIQQAAQGFMADAAQVFQAIQQQVAQQESAAAMIANKPRLKKVVAERVNGRLEATPIYE